MKRASFILSVLVSAFLLQAHGCDKHHDDYPSVCGTDRICTEIFDAVMITVKDANGNPVKLDEYYAIRLKNEERISGPGSHPENGMYIVVDDNFISALMDKTEGFRFIGKTDGKEVVNEVYQIHGDCCHVHRDSGKEEIIIP